MQTELDRMMDTPTTEAQFVSTIRMIWPEVKREDTQRGFTIWQAREQSLTELFQTSDTLGPSKGTAWGAYNVLTEWVDFYAPVPKNAKQPQLVRANRAVKAAIGNPDQDVKARAYELFAPAAR